MNLGLESLTYTARSSYTEDISSIARLCELDSAVEHLSSYITDLAYAYDNITAMRIAVRKYGCTESLSYLFGENFASMEDDNETGSAKEGIFKRIWKAIVRMISIFWNWLVNLFHNTDKMIKKLEELRNNAEKIKYPLDVKGMLNPAELKDLSHQMQVLLDDKMYLLVKGENKGAATRIYDDCRKMLADKKILFDDAEKKTCHLGSNMDLRGASTCLIETFKDGKELLKQVDEAKKSIHEMNKTLREVQMEVNPDTMKALNMYVRTNRLILNAAWRSSKALLRAAKPGSGDSDNKSDDNQ